MKKLSFLALFAFFAGSVYSQQTTASVNEGDLFTIAQPITSEFQHIYFPRKNFIIKRGAVPNMKVLYGTKVVVTSVSYEGDRTLVTLEREDGRKFFRHFQRVDANLDRALRAGELIR